MVELSYTELWLWMEQNHRGQVAANILGKRVVCLAFKYSEEPRHFQRKVTQQCSPASYLSLELAEDEVLSLDNAYGMIMN